MLSVLIEGTLTAAPVQRTTVKGQPFATAKLRAGPPGDDEEDYALPIWAGVIPMGQVFGEPQDDPRLTDGIAAPEYIRGYQRPQK